MFTIKECGVLYKNKTLVGKNLVRLILSNGYTKRSFAKKLNISTFLIDRLCSGEITNLNVYIKGIQRIVDSSDGIVTYYELINIDFEESTLKSKLYNVVTIDADQTISYLIIAPTEDKAISIVLSSYCFKHIKYINAEEVTEVMGYEIVIKKIDRSY